VKWACALVLVALAACSSGGGTKTKDETFATTSAPTTTLGAGAQRTPGGGATTTTTHVPDLSLTSFKAPSGNIGCEVSPDATRCDIREHTWATPPKPATCDLDWGQGIQISGLDKPSFVCAGDTALDPASTVLSYGGRTRQGSVVCESAQAGVTCTNEASGHGFFLSRDDYRIF
jgi:hypothetical protein